MALLIISTNGYFVLWLKDCMLETSMLMDLERQTLGRLGEEL